MKIPQTFTFKRSSDVQERYYPPLRPQKRYNNLNYCYSDVAQSVVGQSDSGLSNLYDSNANSTYMVQCFKYLSCIGQGSFGIVFKVISHEDGKLYAVKRSKSQFRSYTDRLRKLKEVERFQEFSKHRNCVQLFQAWEEKGYLFLQTELCVCSLADYTRSNHCVPEALVWNVLVDISMALKHLHKRGILHMDVKLENILMGTDGSFKLSDFGISLNVNKMKSADDPLDGDPKYLAVEVLSKQFTSSSDIFSLGISLLELCYDLELPHNGDLWMALREGKIPRFPRDDISEGLFLLIKQMMHPKPEQRPTVTTLLNVYQVRKLLAIRKVKTVFHAIAKPGFLLYSLITSVGKRLKQLLTAIAVRLSQFYNRPATSNQIYDGLLDSTREDYETTPFVTSTPLSASRHGSFQNVKNSFLGFYESSSDDGGLSSNFRDEKRKIGATYYCSCCKRIPRHYYESRAHNYVCQVCGGRKCSIAKNLSKKFDSSVFT